MLNLCIEDFCAYCGLNMIMHTHLSLVGYKIITVFTLPSSVETAEKLRQELTVSNPR